MTDKDRHDFFKELYDKEFARKEVIENSINTPISITTALTVLLYFLVSEYDRTCASRLTNSCFFGLAALVALFVLLGLGSLTKMYVNIYHKKYRAIPFADQLDAYRQTLQTYYDTHAAQLAHTTADALFLNYLTDQYIQQTAANTRTNDTKLKELEITKRSLTLAILAAILSLIPFFYNFLTKPDKTYFIELKNPPATPHEPRPRNPAPAASPAPHPGNHGNHRP